MKLKVQPTQGHQTIFDIGEKNIRWLGLDVLRLDVGETWQGYLENQEAALVVLSGRCSVSIEGSRSAAWKNLGSRSDSFGGAATTVYVPRQCKFYVSGETQTEIAIAKAPCSVDLDPTVILPKDVKVTSVGTANWRRDVRSMIPPDSQISQRLIIGETVNPPGNWSGFPPHKHDEQVPGENILEEFYWFKAKPVDGFGLQAIYGNGQGEVHFVGHDDVTLMLDGYHPTVATPGTTLCYLWALSGESKSYEISIDPTFRWLSNTEAIIKEMAR
jgi:5-deoxy-glucuronate isomerase